MNTDQKITKWWIPLLTIAFSIVIYSLVVLLTMVFAPPGILPNNLQLSYSQRSRLFQLHIGFGAVALATGAVNGMRKIVRSRKRLHVNLGRAYVISVLISGSSGLLLAPYSAVGIVDHLGFALLGVFWIVTTIIGYFSIRRTKVLDHRAWMMRSVSLTFGAVTLRLLLPFLIIVFVLIGNTDPFSVAYPIVSFLAWVPNLLAVEYYLRQRTTDRVKSQISSLVVGD